MLNTPGTVLYLDQLIQGFVSKELVLSYQHFRMAVLQGINQYVRIDHLNLQVLCYNHQPDRPVIIKVKPSPRTLE